MKTLDVEGRITLKWISYKLHGPLLSEDTDQWRALVTTVMKLRIR
jgi:hypothetical protein